MNILNNLADVSWIPCQKLRIESQKHFIRKYGFYVMNGERLTDNSWAEGMIDNVVKIGDKR